MKPRNKAVLGSIALFGPLVAILIATVWYAVDSWPATGGAEIPVAGYVAMAAGLILSIIVWVGLMSLVFYSRRHGYDDAADRGRSESDE
jgi:cation transporter-like permease